VKEKERESVRARGTENMIDRESVCVREREGEKKTERNRERASK